MARQLLESDTAEIPAPPRRPWWKLAAAAAVVAIAVPIGFQVAGALPGPGTFDQQTVDHSQDALMVALADVSEYHAATGTFQVLVDLEHDTPWVPAVISGERTTLFATGHADALVDFTGIGPDRVTVSPDRKTATITLPPPRLSPATIDPAESKVVGRDRGIAERLAGMVEDNPIDDHDVYALATQKLDEAAQQSDLLDRAQTNTRSMLTSLTSSLGYDQVTVVFSDPR
jgi:Protein of unknown function (DUF4230)